MLNKKAEEKYDSLKNEQYLLRTKKTMDYLVQRGFEFGVLSDPITHIVK